MSDNNGGNPEYFDNWINFSIYYCNKENVNEECHISTELAKEIASEEKKIILAGENYRVLIDHAVNGKVRAELQKIEK